ncbi:MAG TPA: hypothetical protein VMY80_05895 [Anaerolineae bacterium]|nr:hypothetical protein [Anaerolineae bacterium]
MLDKPQRVLVYVSMPKSWPNPREGERHIQVFITRIKERLGCSQFEAAALTDLVEEDYFP